MNQTAKPLNLRGSGIHFSETFPSEVLENTVREGVFSKVFILTDENTRRWCLPLCSALKFPYEVIETPSGEAHKTLETCGLVYRELLNRGADRSSALIHLGGGVLTDLGGFVASTFMRGIPFINIPTTLLSMVDASVGGKTGVDFLGYKNMIGVFSSPLMTLVCSEFLKTLPHAELVSGFAEMLKHGLIYDASIWNGLKARSDAAVALEDIASSVGVKAAIVSQDFKEEGLRKTLNFGHTVGHAIETLHLLSEAKKTLLHGEAVAWGMVVEAYVSYRCFAGFSEAGYREVSAVVRSLYPRVVFSQEEVGTLIRMMGRDKKNRSGRLRFSLLEAIGRCTYDVEVSPQMLREAFQKVGLCG